MHTTIVFTYALSYLVTIFFRPFSQSHSFGACNQAQTSSKGPLMFAQVLGGNPQTLGYRLRIYRAGYNVRNVKIEKMRSQGVYLG